MAASIRATWLLVIVAAALLVALLASPLASTAMAQDGGDDVTSSQYSPDEVQYNFNFNVDASTIPDKKLPNTGGVPLTGLLLIGGVGSVVAGSLLRVTLGRSRR